jgi:hypothetical protein
MALSRSQEEAQLRVQLRSQRDFERLKRLKSERRENKVYQQWDQKRKAFEKQIAHALVDHDSEQLAIAFCGLSEAALAMVAKTRRLRFSPYRSFASYCRERWHLDPEKVSELINPYLNPAVVEVSRDVSRRRKAKQKAMDFELSQDGHLKRFVPDKKSRRRALLPSSLSSASLRF